jgi:hypothetical protein
MEDLPQQWEELITLPIHKGGKQIAVIIQAYHISQPCTKFYNFGVKINSRRKKSYSGSSLGTSMTQINY